MTRLVHTVLAVVAITVLEVGPAFSQAIPSPTVAARSSAGISLEKPWRRFVYAHARENFKHPAWGWQHSERDYLLAVSIAAQEKMAVDEDVLFAAAFLHDAGAIDPFSKEGVDHAERSAELAEPLLKRAGFPMAKFPAVRSAILHHMFDKDPGALAEAIVLHDADTLDFLGATGVARRLAVTGNAPDIRAGLSRIQRYSDELSDRLITRAAKKNGRERIQRMKRFLDQLKLETPAGATL